MLVEIINASADPKTYGLHHYAGNPVGVRIGGWSSVLKVSITLVATFSWNTNGSTTVGDTVCEGVDRTSLVSAGKTHAVVLAVDGNVLLVAALELLDCGLDVLHASLLTHLLAGEVAVETGTVPVTWNWLWVE